MTLYVDNDIVGESFETVDPFRFDNRPGHGRLGKLVHHTAEGISGGQHRADSVATTPEDASRIRAGRPVRMWRGVLDRGRAVLPGAVNAC